MNKLHPKIIEVTKRIRKRSKPSRDIYLKNLVAMEQDSDNDRNLISCSNMAHAAAAAPSDEKSAILNNSKPNLGIVSSYNDMLSAHKPLEQFPKVIKAAANQFGATAQMAGSVPAMCDGVTQGRPGMELSLMSRDVIAMSTAVALSHGVYDATLCLGVCDKIVEEPNGGAQRDKGKTIKAVGDAISRELLDLQSFGRTELIDHRRQRFLDLGSKGLVS